MVPHSGYHWNRGSGRFFEGWYYRVTLPAITQSFAFMYAIDDPQGHTPYSGGSMQVLGIDDHHMWRTLPNTQDFYADYNRHYLEHWNRAGEGYSVSDRHNKGMLSDPRTGESCTWDYEITTIDTWGDHGKSLATMGFWSYFPVFEPGWQITMAHGLASGSIQWQGNIYKFNHAPAYSEKNWGRAFPKKWFWLQCNSFSNCQGLSLTVAGGIREFLGYQTSVAMVGIHYEGKFYSFMPEHSDIYCQIQPWGNWQIFAKNKSQQVEITANTDHDGTLIMVPAKSGLEYRCRDTTQGEICLRLTANNQKITAHSSLGALEVGGEFWENTWQFQSDKI